MSFCLLEIYSCIPLPPCMQLKIIPLFHFFHSEFTCSSPSLQNMGTVQISHFPQAFLQILFQTLHFHFQPLAIWLFTKGFTIFFFGNFFFVCVFGIFASFYSSQYTQDFKNCYLLVFMTDPSSDLSHFTPYPYLSSERGRRVNKEGTDSATPGAWDIKSFIPLRRGKHEREKTERQR